MADPPHGAAWISFDGRGLHRGEGGGRSLMVDARCLEGDPIEGAYAHVCASPDDEARLPYDQPEVQQVRRDALAWWIPMLGDSLVCLTTLALDEAGYAGAITVARDPARFGCDPFARIFPPTIVRTDLFCSVPAPPGPVLERYAGVAWPGGKFAGT